MPWDGFDSSTKEHDLRFPFDWRFLVTIWKWLFFTPGPFVSIPDASDTINRGAYLVRALGHCTECHTPRNFLGGPKRARFLAGAKGVPNLTPAGLKTWSDGQLKEFFLTGVNPDGDEAANEMYEVIRNTTSQLAPQDLAAMIAYLRTLPPIADDPKSKK